MTSRSKTNKYLPGFAYGSSVKGSTSASSYLWAATEGGGSATPFAQAYLRPKLRFADLTFPAMPAGGLPGTTNRVVFDNYAKPQAYGVSGLANGFSTERDTEVRSMAQIGGTMFVGGNFAKVDKYSDGTSVAQSYLAAFDASSGDWISSFRPTFNGKVNAVAKLPSGLLAVGGEFTTVNGTAAGGARGARPGDGGHRLRLRRSRWSTGPRPRRCPAPSPRSASRARGSTWAAPSRTWPGAPLGGFVYAKRGVRLDTGTGRPDSTWNPAFNAAPIFLTTSSSADRVYYGGFFTNMNDNVTPAEKFVTVTTASPAKPVSGLVDWVGSTNPRSYQQTGVETADRFWLGGSEHMFFDFNRSDFSLVRPNIARSDDGPGGDFQASVVDSGVAYGTCHCDLSYVYGNSRTWNGPTNYDRVDTMRYVAAFDATTGKDVQNYIPWIKTRATRGPWALTVDSSGCLWVGGDLTTTKRTTDSAWQTQRRLRGLLQGRHHRADGADGGQDDEERRRHGEGLVDRLHGQRERHAQVHGLPGQPGRGHRDRLERHAAGGGRDEHLRGPGRRQGRQHQRHHRSGHCHRSVAPSATIKESLGIMARRRDPRPFLDRRFVGPLRRGGGRPRAPARPRAAASPEDGDPVLAAAGRPRQVDDQRAPGEARDPARQRRGRHAVRDAVRPHRLGDPGHRAVHDRARSPPGCGRSATAPCRPWSGRRRSRTPTAVAQGLLDRLAVRHDQRSVDREAHRAQPLDEHRAATVGVARRRRPGSTP